MTDNATPEGNGGDGGGDWRAPLVALAGDNAEFKTALEGFKEPGDLLSRLTAQPDAPDWRKIIAGDNADRLKKLERFTDASAYADSFDQKDAYINSGKKVTVPGENASAEEIAAWNNARGVPEKAGDYQITAKPPEGVDIDDSTKAMLTGITERLHGIGAEPAIVNLAHEIVFNQIAETQKLQEGQVEEGPKLALQTLSKFEGWKSEAQLKENLAWGEAALTQFIGAQGSEDREQLLNLTVFDGERYFALRDFPGFVRLMAGVGRASAEDPLFLEANGANSGAGSVQEQIDAIYALRSSDMKKYNAPETQAQLQKLLAARARNRDLQSGKAA